jgi:hypothetical protein
MVNTIRVETEHQIVDLPDGTKTCWPGLRSMVWQSRMCVEGESDENLF